MVPLIRASVLASAAALLAAACTTTPADRYAQVTGPAFECRTGSRICRQVDPRTGRSRSALPVVNVQVSGEADVSAALSQLPFVY